MTPLFRPFQHMEVLLDKVVAGEAEQVDVGQGELFMAQQSLEFVTKLTLPWVYSELFTRYHDSFPGLPFVLAAAFDLFIAQGIVPSVWRNLTVEPVWDKQVDEEDALEKEAAEIFSAADTDNNQVLSHTELKKYIKAHDEIKKRLLKIGSGEECGWSGLFKDADADGNGEITLAEFKEFFKRKALN